MKRDMDLIRDLLLKLEALDVSAFEVTTVSTENLDLDGYEAAQIVARGDRLRAHRPLSATAGRNGAGRCEPGPTVGPLSPGTGAGGHAPGVGEPRGEVFEGFRVARCRPGFG